MLECQTGKRIQAPDAEPYSRITATGLQSSEPVLFCFGNCSPDAASDVMTSIFCVSQGLRDLAARMSVPFFKGCIFKAHFFRGEGVPHYFPQNAILQYRIIKFCTVTVNHTSLLNFPPPMRLCFYRRLFVCSFVSRIMEKLLNQFSQNSTKWWHVGCGRNHYILALIRGHVMSGLGLW